MKDLIKNLTEAWGPSGYEHQVRALIQKEIKGLADEVTVDALGNVICRVGKGGTKIMVAAHMDEIGVMATYVEKNGYVRFAPIGGLLHGTLYGSRVLFENGTMGVIGVEQAWGENRTKLPELESYYIDVSDGSGATTIQPGSPATFWRPMEERGTRLISKAMDDRIACAIAIEAMRRLKKQAANEVYFVFTVQEEVGLRGARPAAFGVDPDVALAIDVTQTGDNVKADKMVVTLGGGAAIKIHDPGLVVPPAVRDWMIHSAEQNNIPHQLELLSAGTTDASGIQSARAGVPSGCISIPCRYIHTPSETVDYNDVLACVDLVVALVGKRAKF